MPLSHPNFRWAPIHLGSQKVHPTIDKLCAQNLYGVLQKVELVELF
jgi:hypothetical protein